MKLDRHLPAIAFAIENGARRPGHVPGVDPRAVGRVLAHPHLRRKLEGFLAADITLMVDGSFRTTSWFGDDLMPEEPDTKPRHERDAYDEGNYYAQKNWRENNS